MPIQKVTSGILGAELGINGQVFTSNGTFTVPAGVTKAKVTVVGGGGGGYATDTASLQPAGGGGGGATIHFITGLIPGDTIAVTIGSGGTGGLQGGSAATSGGTSSFGSYCSATGGAAAVSNTPGDGGVGSNGSLNIPGIPGGGNAVYPGVGLWSSPGGSSIFGAGAKSIFNNGSTRNGSGYGGAGNGALHPNAGGNGTSGVVMVEW